MKDLRKRVYDILRTSKTALKSAILLLVLLGVCNDTIAGTLSTGQMTKVTYSISNYYSLTYGLMKAISIVFTTVGAFTIYWKMQHGDQDVRKKIIMMVCGCVALGVMYAVIPHMFHR